MSTESLRQRAFLPRLGLLLAGTLLIAACGKAGSPSAAGPTGMAVSATQNAPGKELPKPGGGTFFLDPNQAGSASALHVAEMFWGRLVDVHDVKASGAENPEPCFRDFVVNPGVLSSGVDYTLVTGTITQKTRLIVHAKKGSERFETLLRAAVQNLPWIAPKHDDGSSAPPFSVVPRNACLVVHLDDCLDDDASATQSLPETVRIRAGTPARSPFGARLLFDPNHGGLVAGAFHSTRVLIDLTVSEFEISSMPVPQPLNILGLPASLPSVVSPNVSVRIPTRIDFGLGQFALLTNLSGTPLDRENKVVDLALSTLDVVRAMRSGNAADPNNGFLLDVEQPRVLGDLPVVVERARPTGGRELFIDLVFTSSCLASPAIQDVLAVGGSLLEVVEPALVGPQGRVRKLRVRPAAPVADPSTLLGNGIFHAVFAPSRLRRTPAPCWVSFSPPPLSGSGVSTLAEVRVHFSEPMDPAPLESLDALLVVRGPATHGTSTAGPSTTVIGRVHASPTLEEFALSPLLPLAHTQGVADPYHVELTDVRDLAGNPLRHELPFANFRIDPLEPTQANGAIVLRLNSSDEIGPDGFPDLRGQFFYDFDGGAVRPRPVVFTSWPVDRTNPVPSIMIPFARGVHVPLTPLGSKLHALWRYCDLGWNVRDERRYDLDVAGLSWAPIGGQIVNDFYEGFEIRLAHSRFLPDEAIDNNLLPRWENSGLRGGPSPFTDNILVDPASPQKVVHPRALGYAVNAADLFTSSSGRVMIPYPLNRGPGPITTYTWRDTAVQAKAGPNNQGIPMDIETGPPLFLEPQAGTIAPAGSVPSIGLPLLIEYRCYPSNQGLGLNALDISLAINSSPLPAFRAYSSGGINTAGLPVVVNPDSASVPTGGFNPLSSPPGLPTPFSAENVFYIGQLDTVTRLSRAHTIWLDTSAASPGYVPALVAPAPPQQPAGTQVVLDYRGALGFSANTLGAQFDATRIDAYGELAAGTVAFLNGANTWTGTIQSLNGARYLQVRVTFVSNVATGASPELTALGIPFTN
ncbi:MAG: hypothetical protein HOP15_13340 [Planctomycetes bacterium]|nr:hypothetical protein [Planctomycetota bacterium]